LQADINRFNFQQNAPQQNLATFLSSVYGNPLTRQGQQVTSGVQETSNLQNLLGTAATIGGLYRNVGGLQGVQNLWNAGRNWLGGGSSGGFVDVGGLGAASEPYTFR
jgi:hypothetical protein